jgi:hypothetical protein
MSNATRKTARKSTPRNTPLPAVTGTAKLLQPVGSVGPAENRTGEIEIAAEHVTRRYFVTVHDTGYHLTGYDDKRDNVTTYDIDAACSTCDCRDFQSRAHRREDHACKHTKAIKALVARGKLPAIVPLCKPLVDALDCEEDADLSVWDDATADAEAEAWHSQFDAA